MVDLSVFPLGGCGEIGMNMTVLKIKERYYFIDCGSIFPDKKEPGIQLVLPGIKKILELGIKPTAWLITHGHEDHIGAMPYLFPLLPAPIYAYGMACKLIEEKFRTHFVSNFEIKPWNVGKDNVLPDLVVVPYMVNHSIPHSLGLVLHCPGFTIIHSGDFRIDNDPPEGITSKQSLSVALKGKSVDLWMADSTNAFSPGHDHDEFMIEKDLSELMRQTKGVVVVTSFSSNIWRLKTIQQECLKLGKKLVLMGKSLERNWAVAKDLGLVDGDQVISESELEYLPKKDIVVVSTGSQGELYSGVMRLAMGHIKHLSLDSGDLVLFSSRAIPGNEKQIGFVVNLLSRTGCKIVLGAERLVHVSGHAFQQDLVDMYKTAKPKYFMPLHGEYRHLRKHIEVLTENGLHVENGFLVENGDVLELQHPPILKRKEVGRSRLLVGPGGFLEQSGEAPYKDRVGLSEAGMVCVSLAVHKNSYVLMAPCIVEVIGIHFDAQVIEKSFGKMYTKTLEGIVTKGFVDKSKLQLGLVGSVKRLIDSELNVKPLVRVFIHYI